MLDILGIVSLPLIAFVVWRSLIHSGTDDPRARRRVGWGIFAWFALVATLTAFGIYARPEGFIAIGASIVLPVVAGLVAAVRSPSLRAFTMRIPLATLIALHVGRVLGVFFVALAMGERLPPTFAHTAGWGDVAVAVLAVPVALAVRRRTPGWPSLALAWNVFAFADLVTAVTLGLGSGDNPLRFIHEAPTTATIATLPWMLIPGFLVPSYFLTHAAIFAHIAHAWRSSTARTARVTQ